MALAETKVYFDGSHYIAIPHTEKPPSKRSKSINLEDITPIRQSSKDVASGLIPVPRKDGKLPLEVLAEQPKEQPRKTCSTSCIRNTCRYRSRNARNKYLRI